MYQGATERCIKNGPILSGNSTPLNIMSTHVWEGEEEGERKKKSMHQILLYPPFIFRMFNSAKRNAFLVHFSIFFSIPIKYFLC